MQEAYVNGVSTRKVDRLVGQLGVAAISKDQVSRLGEVIGLDVGEAETESSGASSCVRCARAACTASACASQTATRA